jgi:hypothetical protein
VDTHLVERRTALVKMYFGVFDIVGHDIGYGCARVPLVLSVTQPRSGGLRFHTMHSILNYFCVSSHLWLMDVTRLTLCKLIQRVKTLCMPRRMALEPTTDFEHVEKKSVGRE